MDNDREPVLTGPFIAEESGMVGYRIVGGDGRVAIWVMGEENAHHVVAALNRADEENHFQ